MDGQRPHTMDGTIWPSLGRRRLVSVRSRGGWLVPTVLLAVRWKLFVDLASLYNGVNRGDYVKFPCREYSSIIIPYLMPSIAKSLATS